MDCKKIKNSLTAYLHGELDKTEVKIIHQHLAICESCLAEELDLRKTNKILNKFQFDALPENFDEQLHRKLKPFQKSGTNDKQGIRRIVYAIAATLIITIGLEFFVFQFIQSTEPINKFTDFPTNQTVFRSASETSPKLSLKQRYLEKYFGTKEKYPVRNKI